MKKLAYTITASVLYTLLFACSPIDNIHPFDQKQAAILIKNRMVPKPTQQMIALGLPNNQRWVQIDIPSTHTTATSIMLLRENENLSNWTERIQTKIVGHIYKSDMTARKFVASEMDHAHQNCQQIDGKIVSQTSQYVVYQLSVSGCRNTRNQKQIGKAFNGIDATYVVRYSALTGQVGHAQFNRMLHIIKTAELVRNPRYTKIVNAHWWL
jgi:hypothetical protein